MNLNKQEIQKAINGQFIYQSCDAEKPIAGARIDTREINPGDMFFAIKGQNVDGNDFIVNAIESGASIVVCDREPKSTEIEKAREKDISIIMVQDSSVALQLLAKHWAEKINAKVLGITGSVGKTTSKKLCYDVLSAKFSTTCNKGNLNNELGLPMTICDCQMKHEFLITEMGMNAKGEIAQLCEIAKPDWGLITNIGMAHIEYLGSQDNIAKEKSSLAKCLPDNDGVMFIYMDEQYRDFIIDFAKLKERNVKVVFYGSQNFNDEFKEDQVWFENPTITDDGTWIFDLCVSVGGNPKKQKCHLNLKGKHNIINACGAAAVGMCAGIELNDIIQVLETTTPEHGRQEIIKSKRGYYVINDAYNANPKSMIASIEMFSSIKLDGKKIAFLGDMFELGDYAVEGHSEVGCELAKNNIDYLICVGELAKNIADKANVGGMKKQNIYSFDNLDDAKEHLFQIIQPGDAVLFKASNGMKFSKLANEIVN